MSAEKHDRYAVYDLMDKKVMSKVPRRLGGYSIRGVVKKVLRDPINKFVEIYIANKAYKFQEPTYINQYEDRLVFVYGREGEEVGDEELFEVLRDMAIQGGNINDAIEQTLVSSQRVITFTYEVEE